MPKIFIFNEIDCLTKKKELSMQKYSTGKNEIKNTYGRGKISFRIEVLLQTVARKLIYGRSKISFRIEICLQTVENYFLMFYIKKISYEV
ncbi:MAG: hypothetical protein LBT50_04100 [Prevotellaceae bacterium]|nr:hypothetical protein [Prevotellaceae bacterium]